MIKQIVLLAVGIYSGLAGISQNVLGVFGGVQSTTANYKIKDQKQSTGSKTGAQLGLTLKIPFENQIYFSPQINYSRKGYTVALAKEATMPGVGIISNDVTVHAIDIAPLLHIDFSQKPSHFFVRFGPALDAGIKGTEKVAFKDGEKETRNLKFGNAYYSYLTSLAIAQFGFETKGGLYIYSYYNHGFSSLNNNDGGPAIRHRLAGLALGIYFKRKDPNVMDTTPLDN